MAQFTITQVYVVRAQTPAEARKTLAQWQQTGLDAYPAELKFESVQVGAAALLTTRGRNPWLAEAKDQLLGRKEAHQQPAWKKRN